MLEKNIIHIARYNADLAEAIRRHKIIGNYGFDVAKSGDVVLLYENLPMHSMDDPQKEASDIFNKLSEVNRSVIHLVFGLGLGYLFKRVHLSSKGRIVIYEPNLDILRITLENVDFSSELADERVMVLTRKEELESVFKRYYLYEDPINMCFLPVYKALFPDRIKDISDELAFLKGYFNNNFYTLFETSQAWLEMSLINLNYTFNSTYIDCLKDKFKGKPAIITAAGPSLLKNIEQLKEYENRAVIFSVGAALRTVKQTYNIKPGFAVFIDVRPNYQLNGVDNLEDVNFILQPSVYKSFNECPAKRRFVYLPINDMFSQWLAEKLKLDITHYYNRGTVAISAFYAAYNFGCNPIIFMGQDLAYARDGRVYANDNLPNIFKDTQKLEVPAWDGGTVTTNPDYAVFIRYFNNLAMEFGKQVRIINATEGGAYISGLEHMSFKEAASLIPDEVFDVDSIITEAEQNYQNPFKTGKMTVFNILKENHNQLSKLIATVKQSQNLLSKIKREMDRTSINKNYLLNKFQELYANNGRIDKIINEKCSLLNCLIQKESHAFQQGYGRFKMMNSIEDVKEYLVLTENYYDSILNKIPILTNHLENILKVHKI